MFEIEAYTTLQERLEATKGRITGSKIPAILGLGYQGQNPLTVWLQMTGKEDLGFSPELEWELSVRSHNEEMVLQRFAGNCPEGKVAEWSNSGEFVARSSEHPDLSCTPDGFVLNEGWAEGLDAAGMVTALKSEGVEGVEAKTYRWPTVPEEWEDEPSSYAVVQAHWGMAITGWKRWHIPVMFGLGGDYRQYVVERDDSICKELIEQALEFLSYVKENKPPADSWLDASAETSAALKSIYPEPGEGEVVMALDEVGGIELADLIASYDETEQAKNECESRLARVKNFALSQLGQRGAKTIVFTDGETRLLKLSRSQYTRKAYHVAESVVDTLRKGKA